MVDQTTEWRPDPYGAHEFRFFSADGKPTLLVMDGGKTSYDPPRDQFAPAPGPSMNPESRPDPGSTSVIPSALGRPRTADVTCQVATGSTGQTTDADDAAVARERLRVSMRAVADFTDGQSSPAAERRSPQTLSNSLKFAYGVVFVALSLSAFALIFVYLDHTGVGHPTQAARTTTSATASRTTTTTLALPTALQPAAQAAATALVTSWSTGNKPAALTVATPAAVTALFAAPYASGLAIDRGCSTSFTPIVCTFGPPGGASPTDPIYEIIVSQATGGWYVSSVRVEN